MAGEKRHGRRARSLRRHQAITQEDAFEDAIDDLQDYYESRAGDDDTDDTAGDDFTPD